MSTLLVYASPREIAGLASSDMPRLEIGVGKVAAAMNLTAALSENKPDAVLLAGVCGAYPQRHLRSGLRELEVGSLVLVGGELAGDEGVLTPDGFMDLGKLELSESPSLDSDAELSAKLAAVLECPTVKGATVSTGAGVDALSQAHALRTGAQVETMEGAAVAAVCKRFELPLVQLRAVSNRTGDRERGMWDLEGASAKLVAGIVRVLEAKILP